MTIPNHWPYDVPPDQWPAADDFGDRAIAAQYHENMVRRYSNKEIAHFAAFGEFLLWFSYLEQALYEELLAVSGAPRNIGAAIFSGTRMDAAISFIKRIKEVNPIDPEWWNTLDSVFSQITILNGVRNAMLHYPPSWHMAPPNLYYSNKSRTIGSRITEHIISRNDLVDMTLDTLKICYMLLYRKTIRDQPQNEPLARPVSRYYSLSPWRYKPRTPENTHPKPPGTREARPRPQKPSRS